MRRVLVVAYYFPPSGGPGVQRVLKMIRYLPDYGWEPVVLTVHAGTFPARDETLLADIPPGIHVERTRILEPYALYRRLTNTRQPIDVAVLTDSLPTSRRQRIAQWIRATFFIPDARVGWLVDAIPAGRRLIRQLGIEMLYTSSPPYTCALIGRSLKRSSSLPWVMELRDPWTGFLTTPRRWWLPSAIDRHLEYSCLQHADRVVAAWDGIIEDAMRKYPHLPRDKFVTIPNGFDSADYPPIEQHRTERFTITYTGSLYGLRNPSVLLRALEELAACGKVALDRIRIRLVGRIGQDVVEELAQSPVWRSTEIVPYVPHQESIRALLESDVALLIVDRSPDCVAIVPGKLFEYLGARRAILALAPHGSAVEAILHDTRCGVVCDSRTECVSILAQWYQRWERGEQLVEPNDAAIARYERRTAAAELARTFDMLADNGTRCRLAGASTV
ncbi:MAG: glycosyltransferase family 4 protein [Bacteroidota bacterium]|nr:glycosyltransferase family 4 protein [Bacteroidota bacterium]MDW8272173.1 glycosyltransferase family 4 protein [Bacteroidota bacterium]